MNIDSDRVNVVLALCAVILVAGQQYLLKHPEKADATFARLQNIASNVPSD